jgi:hypothetical protein
MSKRPRILRSERKIIGPLEIVNPDAAGIDAGAEEHVVSVPEDRYADPVRSFGTFTSELQALVDWLVECNITTVAIEATGVYWIPLFEMLEQRGLSPKLVDSRSIGRRKKPTYSTANGSGSCTRMVCWTVRFGRPRRCFLCARSRGSGRC